MYRKCYTDKKQSISLIDLGITLGDCLNEPLIACRTTVWNYQWHEKLDTGIPPRNLFLGLIKVPSCVRNLSG